MNAHPRLHDQRVVIVGTGAMAAATLAALVRSDARPVVASRDLDRASSLAASAGAGVEAVLCDPENPEDVERMLRQFAPLDHLAVFAGGTGMGASSITETPISDAQRAYGRFWASYNALQSGSRHVRAEGSITLLSGSSSRRGVAGLGVWGALHGSIEALARAAALELSPVRVNTVSPGGIGITTDRQLTPHRGEPQDIADAVLALAANPAITGAVLDVDGGERLGTYSA